MQTETLTPSLPTLVFITNAQTPYQLTLLRRIALEIPELRLVSIFTQESNNLAWSYDACSDINPHLFGQNESVDQQASLSKAFLQYAKGGRILALLDQQQIGAVIVSGYNDLCRLRVLFKVSARGVPCLLFGDSNASLDSGLKRHLKALFLPLIVRRASAVLCCGTEGRKYFARYGVASEKIYHFPYEPDYKQLDTVHPEQIRSLRRRFSLLETRRYLLYVGRLVPEKRVDLLIDAFARVADSYPDWDLLVVGDGSLKESLMARVRPSDLTRVRFLGFANGYSDLAPLYAIAELFVLPSDFEPWGVVLTEAAGRMPVVCSDRVGAGKDIITNGENGMIFKSGSLESLVGALNSALSPARLAALKSCGPQKLITWRASNDPIRNLRKALVSQGVLSRG